MSAATDDDRAALVALAELDGIGPATLLRCLDEGAADAWAAIAGGHLHRSTAIAELLARPRGPQALDLRTTLPREAAGTDPHEVLARHRADGRQVLVSGDPGYPARLAPDPARPAVLFTTGPLAQLVAPERPTVAVVGTRNATRVGRDLARTLGADLADAGVAVVSGLALGIDGAAHRGALAAAGPVVGVVAAGLDIAYPRRHADLHREVATHGVLVSETPLGHRPTAWRFPARNRIIAALADVVVVVESRSVGGSMLTAGEALERDVTVLAVPGHPTSPASAGANDLIYDGAGIVRGAADVLLALGVDAPAANGRRARSPDRSQGPPLDADQVRVLEAIGDQPAAFEELVVRTGLGVDRASAVLTALELAGRVSRTAGWYERKGAW